MDLFENAAVRPRAERVSVPESDIDLALTAQLLIAWAGEGGEEKRLAWWRTDLVSEFGGEDLFKRLLPNTFRWATLQAAREAARRKDAELRAQHHNPDHIVSPFNLGFELDEHVEARFQELKREVANPEEALSGLELISSGWDRSAFQAFLASHAGKVNIESSPVGRLLKGEPPSNLGELIRNLLAGFAEDSNEYPLPHYRKKAS